MIPRFFLLVFTLSAATAHACINTPGTDLDGHDTKGWGRYEAAALRSRMDMQSPEQARLHYSKKPETEAKKLEAEALDLIYDARYTTSLPLLQKAEALSPGDYSIAANLGTNFELVGDNPSALRWIKEAIRRNPKSHQGTEWLHVVILEAKLRDAAIPGSGVREPLVPVPDRMKADTAILVGGEQRSASEVRNAIFHQLSERMVFVKPKDPYVADLLFSLAVLDANLHGVQSSSVLLDLAERYGYPHSERIQTLRASVKRALWLSTVWSVSKWTAGLSLLAGFCFFGLRRKWFFLTRAAYQAHVAAKKAAQAKGPAA